MAGRFEELSRQMSGALPRRRVLRYAGVGAAAAIGGVLVKPFRASGVTIGTCTEAGEAKCAPACCPKGYACASSDATSGCCCGPGTTPCGNTCCRSGIACLDSTRGICGCEAGTTPCGDASSPTCCPAGTACAPGCPPPSNNTRPAQCFTIVSDVDAKEHIVAIRWERV
jgi:hypothetical protein